MAHRITVGEEFRFDADLAALRRATPASNVMYLDSAFGTVGDGTTDNAAALASAFSYMAAQTRKTPLALTPGKKYRVNSALTPFDGLALLGSVVGETEFGKRCVVSHPNANLFRLTGDVKDIRLSGIDFEGSSVNQNNYLFDPQDLATGFILNDLVIDKCGFNWYANVINGRVLRANIMNNYFNNCSTSVLKLAGSDSWIEKNFMDSNLATTEFTVWFQGLGKSIVRANYITACPNMGMRVNSATGLRISDNWIDGLSPRGTGAAGCGLYIDGVSYGVDVIGNYIGKVGMVPFANFDSAIGIWDSQSVLLDGNIIDSLPTNRKVVRIGQTANTTTAIMIRNMVYRGTAPRIDMGTGTVTNVSWDEWDRLVVKAGAVADTDFPIGTVPPDGARGLDTTNSRLYFKCGGVWKYTALT